MKYIDADKLIANLRRQKRELELSIQSQGDFGQSCQIIAYESILSLIASLQQKHPEVDIEKEITEHAYNMPHGEFTHESEYCKHEEWVMKEFRHFYELGKKAGAEWRDEK